MPPPLTLVAGLSTTLRDDLVRCLVLRRPGLVAVTYGIEPGGLQRRTFDCSGEQDRRRLEACCLSCAVRADAARALEQVHGADRWQEVVLALPAPVSPRDVAGDLEVDTVTTLVDARLLLPHLSGDDLLVERGLAAAGADRRSTAELVVRQLEDADVLAVADLHRLDPGSSRTLEALLAHLAPLATQVHLGPGGTGCDEVVSTARHAADLSVAEREQLADRPAHRLRWESAGASVSLGDPHTWTGQRGTSLVLTGVGLDVGALRAALDGCLCDDVELTGAAVWEDPFVDALGPAQAEDTTP